MKPPRLMAAIRGTTPANKLKAKERRFQRMSGCRTGGCRGFGKQSQEKVSLAGFLNPTLLLTEGTCLGFPKRVLPKPSPHSSGAGGYGPRCGKRRSDTSSRRAADRWEASHPPPPPSSLGRGTPSLPGAPPPQRQPCSPQRLIPNNIER